MFQTSPYVSHMVSTVRAWLIGVVCIVVLGMFPIACGSNDGGKKLEPVAPAESAPERVVATILIANDTLTLLDLREVDPSALPPAPPQEPIVQWRYESESGEILATGAMQHPLFVTSEFENGVAAPISTTAGATLFEVELPNQDGIFVLSDGATTGGTKPQSWGSIQEKLKLAIKKLLKALGTGGE